MTPLAQKILDEPTKPKKDRTFVDDAGLLKQMDDIHCFECTAVIDLAFELAQQDSFPNTRNLWNFLPAPNTWLEWRLRDGGYRQRVGVLLSGENHTLDTKKVVAFASETEQDKWIWASFDRGWGLPHDYAPTTGTAASDAIAHLMPDPEMSDPEVSLPDPYFRKGTIAHQKLAELQAELQKINAAIQGADAALQRGAAKWFEESRYLMSMMTCDPIILALLAMINTPRIIGRRQHMPHAGLQRRLARSRGMVGKFPLHAWTEIKLEVKPPQIVDGESVEAHLTGRKAFHFCRAHLRVRLGKLEFVHAHWRGDPALGIKQSRYKLIPPRQPQERPHV